MAAVDAVVVGAGNRGRFVFGGYALANPDRLRIAALAEPDDEKREGMAGEHGIPPAKALSRLEGVVRGGSPGAPGDRRHRRHPARGARPGGIRPGLPRAAGEAHRTDSRRVRAGRRRRRGGAADAPDRSCAPLHALLSARPRDHRERCPRRARLPRPPGARGLLAHDPLFRAREVPQLASSPLPSSSPSPATIST